MAKHKFSPLFSKLLMARGLKREADIEDFLYPKYEKTHDPELLPDIDKAVTRIDQAIKNDENVMIFGDYDVDGVTATALLIDALGSFGVKNLSYDLPERASDGYGLPARVVEKIKKDGIKLLITVDCGSSNASIVAEIKKLGVDVIITDHHEVGGELPKAVAVVNPKRSDSKYPFRELSGVGVAFKLVEALQKKLGGLAVGQEKWLLDLVSLGTICDRMNLTNENRIYAFYGLKVLDKTRRSGLRALKEVAKVQAASSFAVGFQLGPRINAAGRMESPRLALELLIADHRSEATSLAWKVNELNIERRKIQDEAVVFIEKQNNREDLPVVFVYKTNWHEGVIGIIASKVVDRYKKPAFVFTGGEEMKCSARSFGDFSVAEAIKNAKDILIKGGGHAGAGGLTIKREQYESFQKMTCEFYRSLGLKNQTKYLDVVGDVEVSNLADLNESFVEEMNLLAPFGDGNPEPIILLKEVLVLDSRSMGQDGRHLRLTVRGKDGVILKTVAFSAEKEWFVSDGETVSIWANIVTSEWNGMKSVEGRIVKLEKVCYDEENELDIED